MSSPMKGRLKSWAPCSVGTNLTLGSTAFTLNQSEYGSLFYGVCTVLNTGCKPLFMYLSWQWIFKNNHGGAFAISLNVCTRNEDVYLTHLISSYRKHLAGMFLWCLHLPVLLHQQHPVWRDSGTTVITSAHDVRSWWCIGDLSDITAHKWENWMCVSPLMMGDAWKECRLQIFIPTVFLFLPGNE